MLGKTGSFRLCSPVSARNSTQFCNFFEIFWKCKYLQIFANFRASCDVSTFRSRITWLRNLKRDLTSLGSSANQSYVPFSFMKLGIYPCALVSLCPCVEDALQKDGFVKFSVPLTSFTLQQASPAWHGEKTTLFWRRDKFAFPIPVRICNRMLWALPPRTTTCWVGTVERWNCNEIFAFDFSSVKFQSTLLWSFWKFHFYVFFNWVSYDFQFSFFSDRSSSEIFHILP